PPEARPGQPMDRPGEPRPGPRPDSPEMRFPARPGAASEPGRDAPFAPRPGPRDERQPERPLRDGAPPVNPPGMPAPYPKFIQRVDGAYPYWIGVRAPIFDRSARQGMPLILILAVPSLGSGGLLLDYTPWLWIGAGLLVCSVLFWIPLVRGITRSIQQMTGAAGEMARGRFETRVETGRRDELGRLGESLNHMSGRLEEYVTGQKRFLGDIAHELCSPLARMEMALGVLEQQSGDAQQGYVNDVREEVRHMSSLVNELLSFTKAGLRAKEIELRPVPLGELCSRVIAREAQGRPGLAVNVDPGLKVLAEPDLLARAVANVLRNALRYAGDAGPIDLTASARGADVLLAITDRGPGVPEESLHRLFDPFYRPESARTREGGGTGLGLAIVKSCVEACGGSVAVKNAQPSGLEVTMTLRRAA
ncbi:MAG: ATP-binding protein, partial [Chthoniobacteraceae bacterium]